jgi:hypothetical protein
MKAAFADGEPASGTVRRLLHRLLAHQGDQLQDGAIIVILGWGSDREQPVPSHRRCARQWPTSYGRRQLTRFVRAPTKLRRELDWTFPANSAPEIGFPRLVFG